jgi:hypothetical protein
MFVMWPSVVELITGPGELVLRHWLQDDTETLGDAVVHSIDHLRPWMP